MGVLVNLTSAESLKFVQLDPAKLEKVNNYVKNSKSGSEVSKNGSQVCFVDSFLFLSN